MSTGNTKTRKLRRTLALPALCVAALRSQRDMQAKERERAGDKWREHGLVFASYVGTELLAGNVRRALRIVLKPAGLVPEEWTPRELRHSFVSLMSLFGVSVEEIADLVGHAGTALRDHDRHRPAQVLPDRCRPRDG